MIWIAYSTSLWVIIVGMIAHGHIDVKFTHYALDLYPKNSYHIIGSFARLLCDLMKSCTYSIGLFYEIDKLILLCKAMLNGKDVCFEVLLKHFNELVIWQKMPSTIWVQWDNCTKTIRIYLICLLVFASCERHIQSVVVYLLVGQTHNNINASFGWWSMRLHEEFSNNRTHGEVVREFGQCSRHPTYDWRNARFQKHL